MVNLIKEFLYDWERAKTLEMQNKVIQEFEKKFSREKAQLVGRMIDELRNE